MNILHIIARWTGGGPERGILEAAKYDQQFQTAIKRKVVVLDKPISAPLFIMARRAGIDIVPVEDLPRAARLENEFVAADIIEMTYWNHPLLLDLLRTSLPPARVMMRCAIAGDTAPHVLFEDLTRFADHWVLSAPPATASSVVSHPSVTSLPSLADMDRLRGYSPKRHPGLRVMYLGTLLPTKLHPDFPDIVARVAQPGLTFHLYGDADQASLNRLTKQLASRSALDRVILHGHTENIADAFSESDIFAYPLTPGSYVTSEKALQEAMWVGLAPVLMTGTAATQWVAHGVTGFICEDSAAFADTITRLAANPALRHRIGCAARRFARQRFNPRENAKVLTNLYTDMMRNPKRSRCPLPGADWSPAQRFLQSLGTLSTKFLELLEHQLQVERVKQCQTNSLRSADFNADILLRAEGGLMHYTKAFPQDEQLRAWLQTFSSLLRGSQ